MNITSDTIEGLSEGLGTAQVDRTAPEERFKSLEVCFGYTIKKLDNALRELLPKLTLFESPFPISAAVEIFGVQKGNIINLYNRSLIARIESENPDYLLYYIHPALRSYLQNISDKNLEFEYGEAFSRYYRKFLWDTFNEWGKEDHLTSITRFNIIAESEYNDFDRAIELTKNNSLGAGIARWLGYVLGNMGRNQEALDSFKKAMRIHEELNDRVGMAREYSNIGVVLRDMGKLQEALESLIMALKIDEELNDRMGMANDHYNLSSVLSRQARVKH